MRIVAVCLAVCLLVAVYAAVGLLREPEECWTGVVYMHSDEWDIDLRFGNTKVCGKGLHLTDVTGPDYETQIDELQRQLDYYKEVTNGA